MTRLFSCILLILSGIYPAVGRNVGLNFVENHVTPSYGVGGQTWQIGAYNDDWIYFANRDGIFEYDGSRWKNYPMNNGHDARALFVSEDEGRVYVSGINEFGYLSPDYDGKMRYVCLSDSLGEDRNIGNLWGIYRIDGTIYVQGDYNILKYNGESSSLIKAKVKLDMSALINGIIYFGTEQGLKMLVGSQLLTARDTESLTGERIRAILPYKDNLLIVTATDGIYEYDGRKLTPFPVAYDSQMRAAEIYCAAMRDDLLAVGTVLDGIYVIDFADGKTQHYNQWNGLQNETVLALAFDRQGDLWVGMDSGIDQIRLTEPITTFNNKMLSIGSGYVAESKNGLLYLGTNRGLFAIPVGEQNPRYTTITGLRGQVWDLNKVGETLFCAHDRGLYIIEGENARRVGDVSGVWTVQQFIDDPDRAWVGTYTGLNVMERNSLGDWSMVDHLYDFDESAYNFVQESPDCLWVYKNPDGCLKVKFNVENMKTLSSGLYTHQSGLPSMKDMRVARINGKTRFSTPAGIYVYDEKTDRIIPDTLLNRRLDGPEAYISLQSHNNYIYAVTASEIIRVDLSQESPAEHLPILPAKARPLNMNSQVYVMDDSTVVMPNFSGFSVFKFGVRHQRERSLARYGRINSFMTTIPSDSVLYAANFLDRKVSPTLEFSQNSVKIDYGVVDDALHMVLGYSYRLNKGPWSELTLSNVKEYTDLPEGDYTFEVKAVLSTGEEATDEFSFKIKAPWYRSRIAYIIYVLLGIAMLLGVYWLERRRIKEKEHSIAVAKDAEIVRQREHYEELDEIKERQIADLEKEKLRDQLEHKSQEIATLLMTMAGKHEALISFKQDLKKIYSSFSGSAADRQSLEALQARVDSALQSESIMDRIEKEFDLVHNNFMKKLKTAYSDLTRNELLMCAYIKMNLSTKEIAPLMNLSPRGVETTRYRMRKKFGLDREASLTDFLKQFGE